MLHFMSEETKPKTFNLNKDTQTFKRKPKDHVPLNLEKPQESLIDGLEIERQHVEGDAVKYMNKKLRQIGDRMSEGSDKYVASIGAHVYASGIDRVPTIRMQWTGEWKLVPEDLAQQLAQELVNRIMQAYGRRPPRKRNRDDRLDTSKPEETIIKPWKTKKS